MDKIFHFRKRRSELLYTSSGLTQRAEDRHYLAFKIVQCMSLLKSIKTYVKTCKHRPSIEN